MRLSGFAAPYRPPVPFWLALILALASGPVLDAGFPDRGWWPMVFVGVAMLLICLIGRRPWAALFLGFVSGVSFYLVHIQWASLYLGPEPWIALSVLEAIFFAVGAVLISLAYRWAPALWPTAFGRLGILPVIVAGLWTAREAIASVWPYGGFAWGRLALSQSESPLGGLVAWLGISGLSFLIVLICAVVIESVRARVAPVSLRVVVSIGLIAVTLAVPAWPASTSGTTTVAAVQGNGKAGYFDQRQPGDILNSQIAATMPIIHDTVDMVVWPEGAADIDPTRYPQAAAELDFIGDAMHAPVITGTITHRDGQYYNTSLLWRAGQGATDWYDKKHPVPFGEYVPDRAFWEPLAPNLIGLIQRSYTPGTRDSVFDLGTVRAGISICFDIADDQLVTDMMHGGADVILAQTNNADFGHTDENVQQLAIARLRAIETGRSLVNISTVGTSEVIDPSGRTIDSIRAYRPGAMVTKVPLGTATTPATVISRQLEWFVAGLGLAGLSIAGLYAWTLRWPRRERR
ncbi:MAG: apolipoprotein N-acyltransferase [Microbacteriaceae bacterium]